MATRKRRGTSPSPSPSPPRKQPSHTLPPPTTAPPSTTTTTPSPLTSTNLPPAASVTQPADPSLPVTPLPADIDLNRCPFTLVSPNHNLLLTLLTQSNNTPHPWIKCHKCGKWRKLPPTLSALSPLLPSLPLTLQSLSSLSAPFLPFPFTCGAVHWDLDRRICSAIQDYQDIVHEWHQVPLKLVRANPRFDFYVALAHFLRVKGVTIREYPCIYGKSVDLYALYNLVYWAGGDAEVTKQGWWPAVYERLRLGGKAGQAADVDYLIEIYRSYFFEWQESRPAVFDDETAMEDGTAVVAAGQGKDGKDNGVASGETGAGSGDKQNGGSTRVEDEKRAGHEEVKEADSERKEETEQDAEMRESDSKEHEGANGASVEEKQSAASGSDLAQASVHAADHSVDVEVSRAEKDAETEEVREPADVDKQRADKAST